LASNYQLIGRARSVNVDQGAPGFVAEVGANLRRSWYSELYDRASARISNPVDPDYDPFPDLAGYEDFAPSLVSARSKGEMDALKQQIDANRADDELLARGDWGLIAGFAAGVLDPANLIPVPAVRGFGLVKGALYGGASTAAISAGTEAIRAQADPTFRSEEMVYSVGLGALIGGVLGGASGMFGSGRTSFTTRDLEVTAKKFDADIGEFAAGNAALPLRATDEGLEIRYGNTGMTDELGGYQKTAIVDEPQGAYVRKLGPDNVYYAFDEDAGWVIESELKYRDRTPVGIDVVEALGTPERAPVRVLKIDDAAIKVEHSTNKWKEVEEGVTPIPDGLIRDADDLVTFRGIEQLVKRDLPRQPGQNPVEHKNAVRIAAINEMAARKDSLSIGKTAFIPAELLDLGNFSPMAKAVRAYATDNVVTDMALRFGGDHGWAVKANAKGGRTPQSIILAAQRHHYAWARYRQKFDTYWNKFVAGEQKSRGMTVQGLNLTAVKNRWEMWGRSKMGERVITYEIFDEMVAHAVFRKGDFEVHGFPVPQEAKDAAKELSALLADYDAQARTYGIRADQRAAEREILYLQAQLEKTGERLGDFLAGTPEVREGRVRYYRRGTDPKGAFTADLNSIYADERAFRDQVFYVDVPEGTSPDRLPELVANSKDRGEYNERLESVEAKRYYPPSDPDNLSPKQQVIVDAYAEQAAELQARLDEQTALRDELAGGPPVFLDEHGRPEPYFWRHWDTARMGVERDKIEFIFKKWFERTDYATADIRAAEVVEEIVNGRDKAKADGARTSSHSSIKSRLLDIPNSFEVSHPDYGLLRVTDFMDMSVMRGGEVYIRRNGAMIEAARLLGDKDGFRAMHEVRSHIIETYLKNAPEENLAAERARMEEALGNLELVRRSALGILRTTDPWSWDNRTARALRNGTALATMGRVVLTAIPEAIRPMMVNGFTVGFRSMFLRFLNDLESVRNLTSFAQETGELSDMVRDRFNARVMEAQLGEGTTGGTAFERWLQDRMPGYFKLTLLTPWTTFMKDWVSIGSAHQTMKRSLDVSQAILAGNQPDPKTVELLAATGINVRDALALAQMPHEIADGKSIIVPLVKEWEGPEGDRARNLMLNAIHGEMRRAIVTPSTGDRSALFEGVLASKGKVVAESDLLTLPLQFMSYGLAAHQKVLVSALQGRDQQVLMGMTMMMVMAVFSNYLKMPENAWRNKTYPDIMLDAYEASGIGGFWFGDTNNMIERLSGNQVGFRPAMGLDPKFGKDNSIADKTDLLGPGPSTVIDFSRAFWDPEMSSTERAQTIRRALPYNNVLWWAGITRNMATTTGEALEQ
jgi:hypothetical protein